MAHPRIRDCVTYLTTLPAAMLIAVCLFLPHTKSCNGPMETPFDSGLWVAIAPIVLFGLLPVAWRAFPQLRRRTPELVLAFTLIVLSFVVVTIPVAIYLMWGYSKRTFRGELLVAMCSSAYVMLWLFAYPAITMFDRWLPAANTTWIAAVVELVGLMVWTSAAAARAKNVDERAPLHVTKLTSFAALSRA